MTSVNSKYKWILAYSPVTIPLPFLRSESSKAFNKLWIPLTATCLNPIFKNALQARPTTPMTDEDSNRWTIIAFKNKFKNGTFRFFFFCLASTCHVRFAVTEHISDHTQNMGRANPNYHDIVIYELII